ncbi:hypothetical protein DYB37_005707 [Aphanomyces astaci]|uniref:GMP phosphodiesterase delta subunit domain-containing protein n=2 Tax=Aphanomyces astaci TaxID=112090 RepID=A0A418F8U5_APHAT|nr:hypothetical protein DYB37_005707 [Aphanomyces astaci]
MKVNADLSLPAIVHYDEITFVASPSHGVFRGMLDRDGDEVALATTLVRYAPNSSFPSHKHDAGEEFLVLEGTFHDDHGAYPTGTYVRNEVTWMTPEDTHVVVPDTAVHTAKDWSSLSTGGNVRLLYQNAATGEHAWFLVLGPGARVESLDGFDGGEEVFVVAGTVTALYASTSTQMLKYSWLRLPPQAIAKCDPSKTVFRNTSTEEAHVFIKTGHLRRFVGRDCPPRAAAKVDYSQPLDEESYRKIRYEFSEDVLRLPTIMTSLEFSVGGKEVHGFRMIERHYFREELVKSYDFAFGFCIPRSTNTWDAVYSVPALDEDLIQDMVANPYATVSDSFYFVGDELIMHNKAEYKYIVEDRAQSKRSYYDSDDEGDAKERKGAAGSAGAKEAKEAKDAKWSKEDEYDD